MKTTFGSLALVFTCWGASHAAPAELPTPGPVINIVEWDGNELPPVYERSDQLPVTEPELVKLKRSGFSSAQLAILVRERRFSGDVSADGLIALKTQGIADEVIQAVSLHALPPNRAIHLTVSLEIDGSARVARKRYLYIIIPDGQIERVFTADLNQILGGSWSHDSRVDQSDLLIPREVRTVRFSSRIPLKKHGEKSVAVFTSARPDIRTVSEIPDSDRKDLRVHDMSYPSSSINQTCRILIRFYQDRVLTHNWTITGSFLECEWD